LWKKAFKKEMVKPLVVLFLLGALQGAVGWIMVASGLTGDAVYVKPTRLALHFVLALGLLSYTFWFALSCLIKKEDLVKHTKALKANYLLLGILVIQLLYGALMAGHKAASVAATWPQINGAWIPDQLFKDQPLMLNFIDNTILIHFIHRGLAYLLFILIVVWTIQLNKINGSALFNRIKKLPLIFVFLQVALGIGTVLFSKGIIPGNWGLFEWTAQLHQLTGMLLLLSLVSTLFFIRKEA
jgi:cytochrome c oxidase assembly protein subunit 15